MTEQVEERLLGRAARIGTVLGKYGLDTARGRDTPPAEQARKLRQALEELGPTFAKLGQILSTRPDLLPPEFIDELARLQDDVTPLTEEEVVGVMETELGVPWEDVFDSIDPRPLAAGTIGQVHRATLENGERVVTKVQRPTARSEIMRDLQLLELFAEQTKNRQALTSVVDLPAAVEHLAESLRRELDFTQEAGNVHRMADAVAAFGRIDVPRVYEELSTPRLLVLEEIQGVPVREAAGPAREEAARELLEFYYRQILDEGFFHADPHPGNMLWWKERIFFLDFGMVGELSPEVRQLVLLLLLAFWQNDPAFLTEVVLLLAHVPQDADVNVPALERDLGAVMAGFQDKPLAEIQLGPVVQSITETTSRHGLRLPAELALTGKALAQMQLTAAELDPTLDPFGVVGTFLLKNLLSRLRKGGDPKRLFYEGQKLSLRATRLIEGFERVIGSRPGPKLQVDVRGMNPLEHTIRIAARRLALAITGGSALVATGATAAAQQVPNWVPVTLGSAGGTICALLLLDLLRRS